MQSTSPPQKTYKNMLLASLPADLILQIARVSCPSIYQRSNSAPSSLSVESVYFLEEGICSMVVALASGGTVEVAESERGFVGMSAILGGGNLRTVFSWHCLDTATP